MTKRRFLHQVFVGAKNLPDYLFLFKYDRKISFDMIRYKKYCKDWMQTSGSNALEGLDDGEGRVFSAICEASE